MRGPERVHGFGAPGLGILAGEGGGGCTDTADDIHPALP